MNDDIGVSIANMIRNRRSALGISQAELSRRMNKESGEPFSKVTLARLEAGIARSITPNMANALKKVLNIPMKDLCMVQGFEFDDETEHADPEESALIGQIRLLSGKYKFMFNQLAQTLIANLVKMQSQDSNQDQDPSA